MTTGCVPTNRPPLVAGACSSDRNAVAGQLVRIRPRATPKGRSRGTGSAAGTATAVLLARAQEGSNQISSPALPVPVLATGKDLVQQGRVICQRSVTGQLPRPRRQGLFHDPYLGMLVAEDVAPFMQDDA